MLREGDFKEPRGGGNKKPGRREPVKGGGDWRMNGIKEKESFKGMS